MPLSRRAHDDEDVYDESRSRRHRTAILGHCVLIGKQGEVLQVDLYEQGGTDGRREKRTNKKTRLTLCCEQATRTMRRSSTGCCESA